jgi:uncharacterized membrane protein HdeD (DUF308 family)
MIEAIVRNWWVFAVRGAIAILFGVLAFVRPDITLVALVALFGAYALLDGILSLSAGFMLSGSRYFWWMLLDGILGIAVGVLTFVYPGVAAASLLLLLGAWLFVSGIFRIVAAIELRKQMDNEWVYILSGVLSIIAGVLTFARPGQSALAWLWVIGTYAILYGVMMVVLSFKLRNLAADALPKDTVAHG